MQDLWADFANEVIPTEGAGRSGGLRQRRLSERAVLATLRSWLLQDYMIPYATSLGATRIFQRCYWIDGLGDTRAAAQTLATPAQDMANGKRPRKKASASESLLPPALQPVAAVARQLAQLDRPLALHGFVLAARSGRRKAPGKQTRDGAQVLPATALPKEGGVIPSGWPELAPTLLSLLEQSAAVFLLNPLKDGPFRYADLLPLYQRTAPTELFLWLSHGQIETGLLPGLRQPEGAAALTNVLRGDRWKNLLAKEDSAINPEPVINGLIDLFAESMRSHFLTVQRLIVPVYTGPALIEKAPCSLLFATRRQDSLYSLNDAVCCRNRRLLVESQQGTLNETWFAAQRKEQTTRRGQALYQEALSLGRTHRVRRWPDLRQQLLLAHFGLSTLKEYDQIILSLLARGEVRCEWRRRDPLVTETPVPGSDDLLLWR